LGVRNRLSWKSGRPLLSRRGPPINSIWLVLAAVCTYLVGYRFYAKFIAAKVMMLDDKRATPAERLRDGHDFEPTNKWIVFGHHFAAIAGPGPLVGPCSPPSSATCPARCGSSSARCWAARAGLRDPVRLHAPRRQVAGQMAREEIGKVGGFTALVTVLLIMIILLAVIALVVVNALKGSPWGVFTIAATMPIAVFMGLYLRYWRPGKVLEMLGDRLRAGDAEHLRRRTGSPNSPTWAPWFTYGGWRSRLRSSSTASSPARCRSGCCSRRAIT
jgi:carbon starvation protein